MTAISAYIDLFIRGKCPGEMSGGFLRIPLNMHVYWRLCSIHGIEHNCPYNVMYYHSPGPQCHLSITMERWYWWKFV